VGAAFGAVLYNKDSWGWGLPIWGIFLFNGFFPLFVISPFYYSLVETIVEEPLGFAMMIFFQIKHQAFCDVEYFSQYSLLKLLFLNTCVKIFFNVYQSDSSIEVDLGVGPKARCVAAVCIHLHLQHVHPDQPRTQLVSR